MKKLTTPEAALPKISYTQAMRSWFLYQGQAYNVETCSQVIFRAYIESITAHVPASTRALLPLSVAPDDRPLARWYTVDSCLLLHVPGLLLFGSEQEATSNVQKRSA